MSKTELFFFRHGQTDYNVAQRIQGQCGRSALPHIADQGLNATGIEQTHHVTQLLREQGIKLDLVIASDLRRAVETAQRIAATYGIAQQSYSGLREMFFGGNWEGMAVSQFKAHIFNPPLQFKDAVNGTTLTVADGSQLRLLHKATDPRYDQIAHPGGETKAEVRARALAALVACVNQNPSCQTIGVVTHSATLRFLMPSLDKVSHAECIQAHFTAATTSLEVIRRLKPYWEGK